MLGKQVWRLICNPYSLVRVYKSKFIAEIDFLKASMGHNPSFIWRSILKAREVIKGGARWRIGSGESVLIRDQP